MTTYLAVRRTRRVGAVAGLAVCLAAGSAALAPGRAAAALQTGTWASPTAGQTVAGTVPLSFTTPNSAVTFVFPDGTTQAATVSGGTATGSWDSSRVANGQVMLGAKECDSLTGCSTTDVTVNVGNAAPAPTPTPTPVTPTDVPVLSPASGALQVGDHVVVSGGRSADIAYQTDGSGTDLGVQALPYTVTVPNFPSYIGQHSFTVTAKYPDSSNSVSGQFTVATVPTGAPKLTAVSAPKTFFPFKDGFADTLGVTLTPDRAGSAVLTLFSGKHVASRTTTKLAGGYPQKVSAGSGLRGGKYTWSLAFTGANGLRTTTLAKPVTADPRKATAHTVKTDGVPSKLPVLDDSGRCARVARVGADVDLTGGTCDLERDDIADAAFFPTLHAADGYSQITMALLTYGDPGELDVLVGGAGKVAQHGDLEPDGGGTSVVEYVDPALLSLHRQLQFDVVTDGSIEIEKIQLSYTYYTIVTPKQHKS